MLTPKVNSKQKRLKNNGLRGNLLKESCHDFMTRKHPTFCQQNRYMVAKSCHVVYNIISKTQLFKSVFFTILSPFKVPNQSQTHQNHHT